jgi:hypothetical protein
LAWLCGLAVMSASADSRARIVRLSNVQGDVQMDRSTGLGFEKAFLNMPLVQGSVLATKSDSRAEVEFEDGTTMRLTPKTTVEFTEMGLRDSGVHVTTIALKTGQIYMNYLAKQKADEFAIVFSQQKVTLTEAVHFRADVEDADAQIAVFKGELKVEGPGGQEQVGKNHSVTFDLKDNDKSAVADNVEEDPYDAWDKQQEKYHDRYASNKSYNDYPYGYGVSDLNYYGSYSNVPGYGWMWQPYFAGAGWSPWADGAWMFYPGAGYTWVSGYPWGWAPYNYGNWVAVPGYGWMWQPGYGNGWFGNQGTTTPPNRSGMPTPPSSGTGIVVVGRGLTGGTTDPPRRVVVQSGSAGFGVPRGTNDLSKFSHQVQQEGFATIHTTAPNRGYSGAMWGGNSAGHSSSGMSSGHGSSGHISTGGHTSAPSRGGR